MGIGELTKHKAIFFLYAIIIIFIGSWFAANDIPTFNQMVFYIILILLGLIAVTWDVISKHEIIKTITFEKPKFLSYKFQIIGAIIIIVVMAWSSFSTGLSVLTPPTYAMTDNVKNSWLSAQPTSLGENLIFFGLAMPTLAMFLKRKLKSTLIAFAISVFIVGALIFPGYHYTKYVVGATPSEPAVMSVALFGIVGGAMTATTGSLILIEALHASNNFFAVLYQTNIWGII